MVICIICDHELIKEDAIRFDVQDIIQTGSENYWCRDCYEAYLFLYD